MSAMVDGFVLGGFFKEEGGGVGGSLMDEIVEMLGGVG